jgi:hypothetical protein
MSKYKFSLLVILFPRTCPRFKKAQKLRQRMTREPAVTLFSASLENEK